MINETLARRAFPGEDPIGLAHDARDDRRHDPRRAPVGSRSPAVPEVYYPIAQNWSQVTDLGMTLVVRTAGDPEPPSDSIRAAVREVQAASRGVQHQDDGAGRDRLALEPSRCS